MTDPTTRTPIERRLLLALAGLVVGLLLAEGACWWRDGGAFAHLHVYQADRERGMRLRPGDRQRHALPGGRPTEVRINAQGYRGDDFPAPGPGQVVVVGDSQVFGLGVEEGETVAARLGARLPGVAVLGAGVPSYGPNEYVATARELLAGREGATLVVVFDPATDVLEQDTTAAGRAIVVGGWLVDARSAARVRRLPGDEALRGSHLLHALRQLDRPVERVDAAPPVAGAALAALAARTRGGYENGVLDGWGQGLKDARVEQARQRAREAFAQAEALIVAEPTLAPLLARERAALEQAYRREYLIARSCTCDCFGLPSATTPEDELERSLPRDAMRELGRAYQRVYSRRPVTSLLTPALERAVRARAAAGAGDPPGLARSLAAITAALDRRDALVREAHALAGRPWPELDPVRSVFFPEIGQLARVAAEHGATLVVTMLPLPQQVGPAPPTRKFYTDGQTDEELAEVAMADFAETAGKSGVRAADARSLGAVARLPDGHLSPAGHDALAGVLAGAVRPGGDAVP